MLPVSLSYNHRVVNGVDAARFTSMLGMILGDLGQLLLSLPKYFTALNKTIS